MNNRIIIKTPQFLLLAINAMMVTLLYFNKESFTEKAKIYITVFMVGIFVVNILVQYLIKGDNYIFSIISLLMSIGVFMVYRLNPELGLRQILFNGLGILAFFGTYYILKLGKKWENYMWLYFALGMALFGATFALGVEIKGATNWIQFGGFSFQPSEIIKILYVLFIAAYYTQREKIVTAIEDKTGWNYKFLDVIVTIIFMGVCYLYIGLLFLQRELGIAMLFFLVFNSMFFVYEKHRALILINIVGAGVMATLGYRLFGHVRQRIEIWLDPWADPSGSGYQIIQSLFAIGAGGFFGTGIGLGHPEFIPEVRHDLIFAAICEEMGIFVGIAIILMFMIIVYRGIKISLKQKNRFFKITALGITSMIGFQAFIILGGVTNMIPLTGITLPFISYGGTSLISSFVGLGILQYASEEVSIKEEDIYHAK